MKTGDTFFMHELAQQELDLVNELARVRAELAKLRQVEKERDRVKLTRTSLLKWAKAEPGSTRQVLRDLLHDLYCAGHQHLDRETLLLIVVDNFMDLTDKLTINEIINKLVGPDFENIRLAFDIQYVDDLSKFIDSSK